MGAWQERARQPFSFPMRRTPPQRTSLEKQVFDKMWNVKPGWNWKETGRGKIFFNNTRTCVEEREMSKKRLETFGDIGPWRDFVEEVEATFHEMKEPLVEGRKYTAALS